MKNKVIFCSFQEANAEFQLGEKFDIDESEEQESQVALIRGDVSINELPLDFGDLDQWADREQGKTPSLLGIIIAGNFHVKTWILNHELDFGPFLLVQGDVSAQNMGCGGSQVVIEGNLSVSEALLGFYNHGSIKIKGKVQAEIIVTDEHLIHIEGAVQANLVIAGNFLEFAQPKQVRAKHWVEKKYQTSLSAKEITAFRLLDPELFDWSDWEQLDEEEQKEILSDQKENEFDFITLDTDKVLHFMREGLPLQRGEKPWPIPIV